MEAQARYTTVGIAVLLLAAALVAAVIWLKQTGAERGSRRYVIYFEEQALDGLQIGAKVDTRGIQIGRVERYELDSKAVNRVRVVVRVDQPEIVRQNTGAVVTRNFVTGIAQIALITPEPAAAPLAQAPEGEDYPVISEGRSDLVELAGRVTQLSQMAADALANINRLFTEENRKAAAETVRNVRDLTASLNQRLAHVEKTLGEIDTTVRAFRQTAAQFSTQATRIGGAADAAFADSRKLMGDVRGVAEDARRTLVQATRSIEALQAQTAQVVARVDGTAASIDDQVLVAVTELRGTLDSMHRTLDRLADPRAALIGPDRARLGPGEKLP